MGIGYRCAGGGGQEIYIDGVQSQDSKIFVKNPFMPASGKPRIALLNNLLYLFNLATSSTYDNYTFDGESFQLIGGSATFTTDVCVHQNTIYGIRNKDVYTLGANNQWQLIYTAPSLGSLTASEAYTFIFSYNGSLYYAAAYVAQNMRHYVKIFKRTASGWEEKVEPSGYWNYRGCAIEYNGNAYILYINTETDKAQFLVFNGESITATIDLPNSYPQYENTKMLIYNNKIRLIGGRLDDTIQDYNGTTFETYENTSGLSLSVPRVLFFNTASAYMLGDYKYYFGVMDGCAYIGYKDEVVNIGQYVTS